MILHVKTISSKAHRCLVKEIRRERIAAGLSQAQVAKRLREYQSWVARLESGQRRLDVVEFLAVARAVGFDPAKLIRKLAKVCNNGRSRAKGGRSPRRPPKPRLLEPPK
jgi:transcriptional regulator with XRE-family HTH domain